jgi:hypothetical protein
VVSLQETHAGSAISHFMEFLTGEKTKAPRRGLYIKLQKNEIDKMEELVNLSSLP